MALILNIETATTNCSVSLALDGIPVTTVELNEGYSHAENLTLFVEKAMREAGKDLSALNAVAVSKGPGSYTGLRIGVSVAKGLCFALNIPLIGVSTLQAMAHQMAGIELHRAPNALYCPMIDARRMEVYCALYNSNNTLVQPISAKIINEHSFADELKKQQLFFFGDGADKCYDLLWKNSHATFVKNVFPSATAMAPLSEKAFNENHFDDLAYFEPFYLKDFVPGAKKQG